jgi:hypothetical protein
MAYVLPGEYTDPAITTSRMRQRPTRCSKVYDLSFVFLLQWRPRKRPSNHYPGGGIDRLGAQETKAARKQRWCVHVRRRKTSDVPSVPWAAPSGWSTRVKQYDLTAHRGRPHVWGCQPGVPSKGAATHPAWIVGGYFSCGAEHVRWHTLFLANPLWRSSRELEGGGMPEALGAPGTKRITFAGPPSWLMLPAWEQKPQASCARRTNQLVRLARPGDLNPADCCCAMVAHDIQLTWWTTETLIGSVRRDPSGTAQRGISTPRTASDNATTPARPQNRTGRRLCSSRCVRGFELFAPAARTRALCARQDLLHYASKWFDLRCDSTRRGIPWRT